MIHAQRFTLADVHPATQRRRHDVRIPACAHHRSVHLFTHKHRLLDLPSLSSGTLECAPQTALLHHIQAVYPASRFVRLMKVAMCMCTKARCFRFKTRILLWRDVSTPHGQAQAMGNVQSNNTLSQPSIRNSKLRQGFLSICPAARISSNQARSHSVLERC